MMPARSGRRPVELRRSWLFTGGPDRATQLAAGRSGADVMILELEDFTRPVHRSAARALAAELFPAWRAEGALAAVRVNPLSGDGLKDLEAVLPSEPDIVMLPKIDGPECIGELAKALDAMVGPAARSVEIVPNVELARGLMQTYDIARSDPRVGACLVASEDMAADLGAERSREGTELLHVR